MKQRNYVILEPEVAGGVGPGTEYDMTVSPPRITRLNYEFDGWLGDDVLESFPSFIITERGRKLLEQLAATGMIFADVQVSKSDEFHELHGDKTLPKFYWMQVHGKLGADDIALVSDGRLAVDAGLFARLNSLLWTHCDVAPLNS